MKKILYILPILGLLFSSCEETVDLDLDSITPLLVIDATLKDGERCSVRVNQTQDFDDQDLTKNRTDAIITLTDGLNSEILSANATDGIYYSSSIIGTVGKSYTITVEVDDKSYIANSSIPYPVQVDSLYIYAMYAGDDYYYIPTFIVTDPDTLGNCYYMRMTLNHKLMTNTSENDDQFINGKTRDWFFGFDKEQNNDEELTIGDTIKIELQSIDQGAYNFYKSRTDTTNPTSNFSGGVLGLFKAYSRHNVEKVITENDILYELVMNEKK